MGNRARWIWLSLFALSVAANIVGAGLYAHRWFHSSDPNIPSVNPILYEFALHRYANEPVRPGETIALGDSFADALANDTPGLADRGIPGETTIGLERRLESILALRPDKLLLWEGVNDLSAGRKPAETQATVARIVARLKAAGADVTILSVIHVVAPATISNPDIDALDEGLAAEAKTQGVHWIDLRAITDEPGLRIADGEHLNAAGLRAVKTRIGLK